MIWALLGLALGIVSGYFLPFSYPDNYSLYVSVGILAAMDSVFGAVRSSMEGSFENTMFLSGFFFNALLAGFLAYLGDRLGVPFYYAPIIVFGGRMFQNFASIRRLILKKYLGKRKNSEK